MMRLLLGEIGEDSCQKAMCLASNLQVLELESDSH